MAVGLDQFSQIEEGSEPLPPINCGEMRCGFGKSALLRLLSLLIECMLTDLKVVICVPSELLQTMLVADFPAKVVKIQA